MNSQNDFLTSAAKNWLRSKGVVGSAGASILGLVLTYQLTGQVSPVESTELVSIAVLGAIGLWGRIAAKRPVKF
jgi:hypothetical protein